MPGNPTVYASPPGERIELPAPKLEGAHAVEETLRKRRSVRRFSAKPLTLPDIAQLLWAAQGITCPEGLRTAPSAGALHPLEVHLAAGEVEGLPPNAYHYDPHNHALFPSVSGDMRKALSVAALWQDSVWRAPAVIAISAVYRRTTVKYGERGPRYVHMEAGHAAQNVCLQAVALGLSTVVIGAFRDSAVKEVLRLGAEEEPLCLIPVGQQQCAS